MLLYRTVSKNEYINRKICIKSEGTGISIVVPIDDFLGELLWWEPVVNIPLPGPLVLGR
jgi:hypothetical protein